MENGCSWFIMFILYVMFSIGGIVGLVLGVLFGLLFLVYVVLVVVVMLLVVLFIGFFVLFDDVYDEIVSMVGIDKFVWCMVLVLGVIFFLVFMCEGGMYDWVVVYMCDIV